MRFWPSNIAFVHKFQNKPKRGSILYVTLCQSADALKRSATPGKNESTWDDTQLLDPGGSGLFGRISGGSLTLST